MKAAVYQRYGLPHVLRLRLAEVPTPEPQPRQVLVEVVATSVNLADWETLRGSPAYARVSPSTSIVSSDSTRFPKRCVITARAAHWGNS